MMEIPTIRSDFIRKPAIPRFLVSLNRFLPLVEMTDVRGVGERLGGGKAATKPLLSILLLLVISTAGRNLLILSVISIICSEKNSTAYRHLFCCF